MVGKPKNKPFIQRTVEEEIKSILQQYPDDGQIFKEIIQNAEDAGASEVVFIYDKNEFHSQDSCSNENLDEYQGPSLYSFNDAQLEEDDWKGIRSLGISRKVKDPLKVGRFGLGFKSVFHLTDLPCIVSGTTFVYLDPSKQTSNDEVREYDMEENENLMMVNTCAEFDCFRRLGKKYWENGTTKGSLFKFALRKKPSVFSSVCYDEVRFQALIEKFLKEAYLPLIFLKNIKLLKMYVIENSADELKEIYSISLSEESQHEQRQAFSKIVKSFIEQNIFNEIQTLNYELQLLQNFKGKLTKFSYVISEYFGFNGENEQFNQMMLDEELSYLPLIAVALPIEGDDIGGHIFTALPLPLQVKCMTGMPVHINGFFALGQDRKDLKWRTLKEGAISNDKTVNWNNCLIQELLPLVYSNLLKFLINKNNMIPETSYKAWPREDKVDQKWRMFLNNFYNIMYEIPCIYIESKNIWVLPKNTLFINDDSKNQVIRSFFEMSNKNITSVDPSITSNYPNKLTWVTSKVVCTTLKEHTSSYQALLINERTTLLSFALTQSSDLVDILDVPLFPLVNGKHVALSNSNPLYLVASKEIREDLLPTKEWLINSDIFIDATEILGFVSSLGMQRNCNLKVIDSCETIINAIHQLIPKSWKIGSYTIRWPDSQCAETWIDELTSYMRKNWDSLHLLKNVPFIPVVNGSGLFLHKLSTEQNNQPMLPSFINDDKKKISSSIKQLLESLGVCFVAIENMEKDDIYHLTTNNYILSPNSKNIITILTNKYATGDGRVALHKAFEEGGLNLKVDLCKIFAASEVDIPRFIHEWPLFPVYKSAMLKHVSPNHCIVVEPSDVPEVWKNSFFPLVDKNDVDRKLLQKFGIQESSYFVVCEKMLEFLCKLTKTEQGLLFDFVLLKSKGIGKLPEDFLRKIRPHIHIKSGNIRVRPSELFEVNDVTTKIFYGEDNKLADPKYEIQVLKQMALRSDSSINWNDINVSILSISQKHKQLSSKEVILKVEALLNIIKSNHTFILQSINTNLSWIPVATVKFSSYPRHLLWHSSSASSELQFSSPNNVFLKGNEDFIGSICHLVHPQLDDAFKACFGIQVRQPTIAEIMKHLENIHEAYNDEEKGFFKDMVLLIYEKFSKFPNDVVAITKEKEMMVWHRNCFISSNKITLTDISIPIEPYFYKVTEEVSGFLEEILTSLNCGKIEFDLYLIVLKNIAERNGTRMPQELDKDCKLSITIVKHLANHELENSLKCLSEIYVPVESEEGLWLHPLTECFYIDKKKSAKYTSTASSNKILHRDLGKEIATSFKIPNLLSKVLGGKKSNFIKPWGQGESLTLRLNKLLKEYQDGLAIIKELVQNADDAGASQFKLLYDKRQNNDMKDHLIDCNMSEWQGPALWVYNDKNFTEADFQNITKINAGTKEFDTTKIGKFGLGFNSVYHLTDVPSFLSGDSLVIFDPHAEYLGDALESKDVPGIRVSLSENIKEFISFKHQFEVFNGIFGAKFNFNSEKPFHEYPGTLFRLPLRNHKMAEKSEIKKLEYSENEVSKLLEMFENSLDDLILFTQNITSLEVWELRNNATSEPELLYSLVKESGVVSSESSIINIANTELEAISKDKNHKIEPKSTITEMKIVISKRNLPFATKKWLTVSTIGTQETFHYAVKQKGLLPCGGISLPIVNTNDNIDFDELIKLNFEGTMFCFLPLPIKSCLPIHVNGAFEISNNRQSLHKHSTDEKDYDILENWNDLLGSDLSQAYFELLCQIPLRSPPICLDKWALALLPQNLKLDDTFARNMITGLLEKILNSKRKIFPALKAWKSWSSLRILDPGFTKSILTASLSFVNWYYSFYGCPYVCVVFPSQLHGLFKEFGFEAQLNEAIIYQHFLFKMFLQVVDKTKLEVEIRNTILDCILQLKPEEGELKELLKSSKCIPTKPAGIMKNPSELVMEGSKAANVFFVTDEVFPMVEKQHLNYLCKELDMNKNKLPWSMLIERAKSVEILFKKREIELAKNRLTALLLLMDSANECPTDILDNLRSISFLEVLSQPDNRMFLKWHGEGRLQFGKPADMFNIELQDVVSCSAIICKHRLPGKFLSLVNETPQPAQINNQMKQLVAAYKSNNEVLNKEMVQVLDALYEHFESEFTWLKNIECVRTISDKLAKPSQVFFNMECEVPGFLFKLHPFLEYTYPTLMLEIGVRSDIETEDCIKALESVHETYPCKQVVPSDVVNAIVHKVVPYLCTEPATYNNLYLPDQHGIMYLSDELCYKDVDWLPDEENVKYIHNEIPRIHVMDLHIKSLRADLFMKKADADQLWSDFGQKEPLTTRIKNLLAGYSEKEDIFKEMFQNADDAGATEIEFILDKRTHGDHKILSEKWKPLQGPALLVRNNGKFTKKDLDGIQSLGVGNKSEDPLSTGKYGVGFNAVYTVTDCPVLLTDVEGFEDVLCIFDPNLLYVDGATEERPGRMLKGARKMLELYADVKASFLLEEVDSKGHTLFRFPLRSNDMAKTSKISSSPASFYSLKNLISQMKERSNDILLFLKNIRKISYVEICENGNIHRDTFIGNSFDVTKEETYVFNVFQRDFYKNIQSFQSLLESQKKLTRRFCLQHFYRYGKLKDSISLKGKLVQVFHWDVVEQCGFSNILGTDLELYKKTTKLIPKGGVAKLVNMLCCVHCEKQVRLKNHQVKDTDNQLVNNHVNDTGDRVFCTLPLSINTGIPAIINGNFILDYETRRNLWSNTALTDEKSLWNKAILKGCVLPCYTQYMMLKAESIKMEYKKLKVDHNISRKKILKVKYLTEKVTLLKAHYIKAERNEKLILSKFYEAFPLSEKCIGAYWKTMTEEFYKSVYNLNKPLLLVEKDGIISFCAKDDFLLYVAPTNTGYQTNYAKPLLLKVLQNAGVNVDKIPNQIKNNFIDVECPLTILTPSILRNRLVSMATTILPIGETPLKDTVLKDITNILTVLKFCLFVDAPPKKQKVSQEELSAEQKAPSISLIDLPLCVLSDDTLTKFSEIEKKFFTKFSTLFQSKLAMFVHCKIFNAIDNIPIQKNCFLEFQITEFQTLLAQCFPKDRQQKHHPVLLQRSTFSKEWIENISQFFYSLKQSNKDIDNDQITDMTKEWIKSIWQFLCSLKNSSNDKDQLTDLTGNYSGKEIDKDQLIDLSEIGDWPLLLVVRNGEEFLLPVAQRETVLTLDDKSKYLNDVLKKCGIFLASEETYPPKMVDLIFGNVYCANNLISALTLSQTNSSWDLKPCEAKKILDHLNKYYNEIRRPYLTELKRLSLFERFDGVLTKSPQITVMLPQSIPLNGIGFLQDCKRCIFLKHDKSLYDLYKLLGFPCLSWMTFYNEYLLPYVEEIENDDVMFHIKFLHAEISMDFEHKENQRLIENLRKRRLFPSGGGEKKPCIEMYDPNNEIFVKLLSKDKFPTEIYCNENWLPFLKKLGLICELTKKLFIFFAEKLENTTDINKLSVVSNMLCRELCESELPYETWSLDIISHIKFIIPSEIRKSILKISNSFNATTDRICYRDSCLYSLESLVWTTKYILPEHSTESMSKKTLDYMCDLNESSIDSSVIKNLENILCNAPNNYNVKTTTYREINKDFRESYEEVLNKFYNYILNQESMWKERLVDLPCILVNDGKGLEVPRRAVLSEEMTICPYLNQVKLGSNFQVLKAIGCHEKVSVGHLVDVLQEIHSISKDSILGPNELEDIKKVTCSLSNVLMKSKEDNKIKVESVLYLPTVTFTGKSVTLKSSSECLFMDDCHMDERLKKFDAPLLLDKYLVSDKDLDPNNIVNINLMNCLPFEKKPKLLSQSIIEVLSENVLNEDAIVVDPSHVSNEIKNRIKNPFFISSMERLFLHERLVDVSKIYQCLRNVRCFVKSQIQTHLLYKDQVILGSEVEKKIFIRNTEECLEIYFCPNSSAGSELYSDIGAGILTILGNQLKDFRTIMAVPVLLSEDIAKLSVILDDKNILRNSSSSLYKSLGLPPIPGEPVPLELHALLRSDFSSFDIGEYVAVERTEVDKARHYYYAIFRRSDQNTDIGSRLYGLQLTENANEEDVAAYLVFKFDRGFLTGTSAEDKDTNGLLPDFVEDFKDKSYDIIIREIQDVFANLQHNEEKAQKVILRRLYLAWHPDKHPEETKELATRVFQYIQDIMQKPNVRTIDCDDWDQQASGGWDRYRDYTQNYRESYSHNNDIDGGKDKDDGFAFNNEEFYVPPTLQELNPQPSEARRWWKQADYDIKAADEVLEAHEWVCYMAHQAAEKALKAAKYKIHYELCMTHRLPYLVSSNESDSDLREWANELERITSSAEAMRYPDRWTAPNVPHNQYTSSDAESAKQLARQIVEYVGDIVN